MIWLMRITPRVAVVACLGAPLVLLSSACNNDWSIPDSTDAASTTRSDAAAGARGRDAQQDDQDSSSGPSDAQTDSSAAPGAQDGSVSGPTDAGLDAQTQPPDAASAPIDSGASPAPDAAPPADAGVTPAVPFCQGMSAIYCRDYEGTDALEFNWTQITTTSQASLAVVDQAASSRTHALKSTLSGVLDEIASGAVWLLGSAPRTFRASFDFLPQLSLPAESNALMFWFRLIEQSGDNYPGISLASRHDGTFLVVDNFDGTNTMFDMKGTSELPGGWVHVSLEVTSGTQGKVTVRFNDTVALEYNGLVQAANVTQSFAMIGLYSQDAKASSALYDNVVIDAKP